ncbi:MAG: aminotransferase class V-fold PLP-dependent enzyme [Pseudomonadota bacterium]|nr:aminotransferase class V-fold PLP-dependent enzyme [Pseudomonadota bacterium]
MPDTSTSQPGLFERLGLRRIVNVSGTETTKGASPVCPEVVAAVSELVPHSVEMAELQSVASATIASALETEAGFVTNCTAAGITVAIAACMTGRNLARVEQLPDTAGMKNEVVIQRGHNVTYGGNVAQNIRIAGARVIEIGAATECGAYQLHAALNANTAAALYVVSHHTVQSGLVDLETFCEVCHEAGVPVIVDGAAEPDPRMFLKAGADIVIFSTQKAFAGLTGGVVAGRMELMQACAYQERGIGRPMKAGKETVIGAIAALERWMALDHGKRARDLTMRLERAKAKIEQLRGMTVTLEEDATSHAFHRLLLFVQADQAGISAFDLSRALWEETPSIFVRNLMADIGLLQVDFRRVDDRVADWVAERIVAIVNGGTPRLNAGPAPAANLADLSLASLERWPLALKPRS